MPIKVYIDQGHNPRDYNTGAEGNGYFEQDITYEVGRLLYDYLEANPDFTPRLSRPTPETLLGTSNASSVTERVRQANAWGADVFISLHTNASVNPSANGAEALIYDVRAEEAYMLAEDILAELTLVEIHEVLFTYSAVVIGNVEAFTSVKVSAEDAAMVAAAHFIKLLLFAESLIEFRFAGYARSALPKIGMAELKAHNAHIKEIVNILRLIVRMRNYGNAACFKYYFYYLLGGDLAIRFAGDLVNLAFKSEGI